MSRNHRSCPGVQSGFDKPNARMLWMWMIAAPLFSIGGSSSQGAGVSVGKQVAIGGVGLVTVAAFVLITVL